MAIKITTPEGGKIDSPNALENVTPIVPGNPGEPIVPIVPENIVKEKELEHVDVKDLNLDDIDDVTIPETESTWGKEKKDDDEGKSAAEKAAAEEIDPATGKPKKTDAVEYIPGNESEADKDFYSGVAGVLRDRGMISGDSEIKTEEDLVNAFEAEIQGRLDTTTKKALEYMGNGVPQQEIAGIQKALQETEAITNEMLTADEKLAANVIFSEFKFKGFSDDDAKHYTSLVQNSDSFMAEAQKSLAARKQNLNGMIDKTVAKYKQKQLDSVAAEKQQTIDIMAAMDKQELFDRKLSPATVAKLKNTFNTVVGYTEANEPVNAVMKYKIENPVDFEHKLVYLFTVTDGFKNMNALDRNAESRISKEFRNSVPQITNNKNFNDRQINTPKTKIDLDTVTDIV